MTEDAADAEDAAADADDATTTAANGDGEATDADVAAEVTDSDVAAERSDVEPESTESTEPTEASVDDGLADSVSKHDEELAEEVADLEAALATAETELAEKRSEVEDLEERLKRKQADFQNYKKRAKKRQTQLKERATEDLVERVVTIRDNLIRALDQDEDADIRPGIESTLEEFDRILADENVELIEPEPGEDVDPTRHQVMMRVESDQPEGSIVDVYQPGYEMAEKVIREAQITVSQDE